MPSNLKPIITKSESGEVIQINFRKTEDKTLVSHEELQLLEQQIKLWEQELSSFDKSLKIVKTLLSFKIKTNEEIHNLQCEKSKKFLTSADHMEILYFLPKKHDNPLEIETPYLKENHSEAESIKHLQLLEQIAFDISIPTPTEEQLNHIKDKIGFNNAQPDPDDTNGWILWDKAEAQYTLEKINKAVAQVSEEEAKIHYYEFELWKLNYDNRKKHEAEWIQTLTDEHLEQHYKNIIQSLVEQRDNTQKILKAINQFLATLPSNLSYLPTPNHVPKVINKKQKGILRELDKTHEARALLKQKILEDLSLTEEQKNDFIEKINSPGTNTLFELDKYLGSKLDPKVNVVLRAIRAIVFNAVQSKEVESHHHPIKFSTNKLYELCGVCLITDKKKNKKWYHPEQTKKIISILTSSLTERILVKDEFNNIIKSTSFLLETTFHKIKTRITKNKKGEEIPESIIQEQITHITIKISDFLFANHINQLENSYLQDIEGYIKFKKLNDTTIGNELFLWLEIYLSRVDKLKEVNLNTIIKELMLEEKYKHNPKRVRDNIERALTEMIELRTLIKDYKLVLGARAQEKYIFTNARYLEKPELETVKSENKTSTKNKKLKNKK